MKITKEELKKLIKEAIELEEQVTSDQEQQIIRKQNIQRLQKYQVQLEVIREMLVDINAIRNKIKEIDAPGDSMILHFEVKKHIEEAFKSLQKQLSQQKQSIEYIKQKIKNIDKMSKPKPAFVRPSSEE